MIGSVGFAAEPGAAEGMGKSDETGSTLAEDKRMVGCVADVREWRPGGTTRYRWLVGPLQ